MVFVTVDLLLALVRTPVSGGYPALAGPLVRQVCLPSLSEDDGGGWPWQFLINKSVSLLLVLYVGSSAA